MRKINIYIPVFLVAAAAFTALEADTIYLRNGRTVDCAIYGQTRNSIRCRLPNGKKVIFSKRRIRRVAYGSNLTDKARRERLAARKRAAARRQREARRARERRELERRAAEAMRKQADARKIAVARRMDKDKTKRREIARGDTIGGGGALWRSLFLPGWGQAARGDTWRGALLGGGFFLAAGGAAVLNSRHASAKATYDESARNAFLLGQSDAASSLLFSESGVAAEQAAMAKAASGFQAAAGLAAVIYLYTLIDAYFFTRELPRSTRLASDGEIRGGLNFHLGPTQGDSIHTYSQGGEERMGLSYTLRF